MAGSVDGVGGGGSSKDATDILEGKLTKQTGSMKEDIANMDPSTTMESQLKMTRGIQNFSLYYSMEINLMNTFSGLLMKAINGIHIPQ